MPELSNYSPFPNFRYYSSDNKGRDFGVIIVKATYEIAPSGRLLVAEEQAPMVFDDECHGEVNETSLWHPSDLVPHKPRTDIIVNAVARMLNGEPKPSWQCGVQVEQPDGAVIVSKALTVTGPRQWLPRWNRDLSDDEKRDWRKYRDAFAGWELSEPEPIRELPVRYGFAFGGLLQRGLDKDGNPVIDDIHENPIGRGWIDRDWTDHTQAQLAPQLELYGEPIADPYKIYKPQSLGPIPCAWEPRLPLAGTYGEHWRKNIRPNWPPDYSFAYHNSAHPDLICPGHLTGNERIRLFCFYADRKQVDISLPGGGMMVEFVREDGSTERRNMVLDTVFLDCAAPNRRDARIYLSWRINFQPDEFEQANLIHETAVRTAREERQAIRKGKAA